MTIEASCDETPRPVLTIACVKVGSKYSDLYVKRLNAGIRRWMPADVRYEFVCFCDKPIVGVLSESLPARLPGWFSKLELFALREPLLYFDLDVVITGSLQPLLDWDGFGVINDYWMPGYNTSVMKLTGDEHHVWDNFAPDSAANMRRLYLGDQQWVTEQMPGARTFPPHYFPSYKANKCFEAPPSDAMAVVFHGEPKPCQISTGWVPELWR